MLRHYMRVKIKAKSTVITFSILMIYGLIGVIFPQTLALTAPFLNPGYSDSNYYSFFSSYSVTFLLVPILFIYLQFNRQYFDNDLIVVRIRDACKLLILRIKATTLEMMLLLAYIYFLILIRQIFFKPTELLLMVPYFLKCASLQLFGLLLLSLIYLFICSHFGNGLSGLFSCLVLVAYDFTFSTGKGIYALFVARSIYMQYLPLTKLSMVTTLSYLVAVILLLLIFERNILEMKDHIK